MSEIDKAITHLKSDITTYQNMLNGFNGPLDTESITFVNASIESYKIAIQALEEKQQREQASKACETCRNSRITKVCRSDSNQCEHYHPELEIDKLNIVNKILKAKYNKLKDTYTALENDLINARMNLDHTTDMLEQQRWIPVSERLPKEDEEVLITLAHGKVVWAYLYLGEWNTLLSTYPRDCVLAWMPLPEPYKEDSHE